MSHKHNLNHAHTYANETYSHKCNGMVADNMPGYWSCACADTYASKNNKKQNENTRITNKHNKTKHKWLGKHGGWEHIMAHVRESPGPKGHPECVMMWHMAEMESERSHGAEVVLEWNGNG